LAAEVLPHFKQGIEEMILVPSGGGKFEIFLDDRQIYSKLETGEFPEPREIVKAIAAEMKG
jgi:selenoprotein W-related protein